MKLFILSVILFILPFIAQARVKVYLSNSFNGKELYALELVRDYFNFEHKDIELVLRQEDGETILKQIRSRRYHADLFIWANDIIGSFVKKGIIVSISQYIPLRDEAKFISPALNALKYTSKGNNVQLYGLPLSLETLILFYNKDIVSTVPKTLSALINASRKHTDLNKGRYGLLYPSTNYYYNAMILHSFGGRTFTKSGKVELNTIAQARTIFFVLKLSDQVLPLQSWKHIKGDYVTLFNEGKVAYYISGPWDLGRIKGVNYGVSQLPVNDETGLALKPFLGVKGLYLLKRSRHKKAAVEVLKYLTSAKMELILSFLGGEIPANLRTYNYDELRSDKIKYIFKKQAINSVPMPNNPSMAYVWYVMNAREQGRRRIGSIYERAQRNPRAVRYLLKQAQRYCERKIKGRK